LADSQNGFTAIVQHGLPNSQEPQCMDARGHAHAPATDPDHRGTARRGRSREAINRSVAEAFAKGVFQPPTRPGVDYMLSTENVVAVDKEKGTVAPFPPHVMSYAPYLTNADVGSDGNPAGCLFVVNEGSPHALIIVPVGTHAHPNESASKH
jgi:hypothetical protein